MTIDGRVGQRVVVAFVCLAAVASYAVFGVFQILVWNPLAAVPRHDLAEIHALMAAVNESINIPLVIGYGVIGILLSIVLSGIAIGIGAPLSTIVIVNLGVLVGGAPAYAFASFAPGMGIADSFGVSGADYAPWGEYLYALSAVSLLAMTFIALVKRSRTTSLAMRMGTT